MSVSSLGLATNSCFHFSPSSLPSFIFSFSFPSPHSFCPVSFYILYPLSLSSFSSPSTSSTLLQPSPCLSLLYPSPSSLSLSIPLVLFILLLFSSPLPPFSFFLFSLFFICPLLFAPLPLASPPLSSPSLPLLSLPSLPHDVAGQTYTIAFH